jgi:hybrid cluster-associated redox disulfide protein
MAELSDSVDDLTLNQIMQRWPGTIRVFIDWHLHCVGCPIADFHYLADSALEHGCGLDELRAAVLQAIEQGATSTSPLRSRRRS